MAATKTSPTRQVRRTAAERFWERVEKVPGGCWLWTGALDIDGYGLFWYEGRTRRAHRVAYELLVGHFPIGLVSDHLCRVRRCVRPDHIEPVTNRENLLRGDTFQARNAAKTACVRGHPFDESNTYRRPTGRGCRTCAGRDASPSNGARTQCIRGHPLDDGNTYWYRGRQRCRACHCALESARRARKRAATLAA